VYNLSFCGATNSGFLLLELLVYLERLLRCKTKLLKQLLI
jgi:hypothetical protein